MFNWIEEYIEAGSPKVSPKKLALLAYNKNSKIRLRVAENPNTPADVLAFLAKDKESDVRLAVATGHHTPFHLVEKLARDPDPTVRHGIAEDTQAPHEVLQMLAEDDNAYVSCRARKTLESLGLMAAGPRAWQHCYGWSNHNERCRFA